MNLRVSEIAVLAVFIASVLIGAYFYPMLPETIASHWDENGIVNGYMGKFWALFLVPMILLGIFAIFAVLPRIDPLKSNIEKFRKHFDIFMVIFALFLLYVNCLAIIYNLGIKINILQFMAPMMGLLFFYLGVLLKHSSPNWFIGIRTPWTLSSEEVWNKTHKIGGILFKISGIITICGTFVPEFAIWLILAPIIASAAISMAYSYIAFQGLKGAKKTGKANKRN